MPERITKANLEARVENLNRRMKQRGSVIRYAVQSRNGHTALDRCTEDDLQRGTSLGLFRAGTKREIGELLTAMMVVLDDAARKEL